jgi:hypothetical protein
MLSNLNHRITRSAADVSRVSAVSIASGKVQGSFSRNLSRSILCEGDLQAIAAGLNLSSDPYPHPFSIASVEQRGEGDGFVSNDATPINSSLGRNQLTYTLGPQPAGANDADTLHLWDSILDCGRYNKFSVHLRQPNLACGVSQKYGVLFFPMS